ncbi:MAG: MarR family transcriptional regulator [Burkholderiaceae bacterium]|jgi:predicted transcriptional regulator|nr:MarR family transcriptional regulator [Burkholderiaceae bacterium]
MKAIIEVKQLGQTFKDARRTLAGNLRRGQEADYHLSYESARDLCGELTPARMDVLRTLRDMGAGSVKALAETAGRNYSNVHTDVARLIVLGLIERLDDGTVRVPFDEIDICVVRAPQALAAQEQISAVVA